MHHSQRLKIKSFLCITKKTSEAILTIVSLIYFMISEIDTLTKFRWTICYTFIINCTIFEKLHGFSINMQWKTIYRIKCKLPFSSWHGE